LAAAGEEVHLPVPEHPLEAVESEVAHDVPLLRREFPGRSLPEIRPVADVRKEFAAVVAELDLRPVLMITAVGADAAERPDRLVFGRGHADFFGERGGGFGEVGCVVFQQRAAEDVGGDEDAVVAGVARQEFRLAADFEGGGPFRAVREQAGGEQEDVAHGLRNRHVVPPPVRALRTVGAPPCDRLLHRFPDCLVMVERVTL